VLCFVQVSSNQTVRVIFAIAIVIGWISIGINWYNNMSSARDTKDSSNAKQSLDQKHAQDATQSHVTTATSNTGGKTAVMSCPLAKHVAQFATANGTLTTQSMTDGHTQQGIIDGVLDKGVYVKCWAIQNLMTDRKLPHTLKDLLTVVNPARTGMWTADGQFDEKAFSELSAMAVLNGQKEKVLTQAIVTDYLSRKVTIETGTATKLGYTVPVTWKAVTAGSIKELFLYYSDSVVYTPSQEKINAMTLGRFRQFYTDPESVVADRIERVKRQSAVKK
jgi:hypothetical protein